MAPASSTRSQGSFFSCAIVAFASWVCSRKPWASAFSRKLRGRPLRRVSRTLIRSFDSVVW
ncbi:MAG: hypothetical protein Q7R57_00515 [Dehalococcoidales bacterium]|nr:hypothetical protein [Dehalococcoidales bacterium]